MIELEETCRGFAFGIFKDNKGVECSIQDSSLATEEAIWFGVRNANPRKLINNVFQTVNYLIDQDEISSFDLYRDVLFNTRMHLTTKHVKTLIRNFEKFLTTKTCRTREFNDRYGVKCSIRSTQDCLELGCDDPDPRICKAGWRSVSFPENTVFTTHMFLGVDEIVEILPLLRRFIETGYVASTDDSTIPE
jgi:hypothetical protein